MAMLGSVTPPIRPIPCIALATAGDRVAHRVWVVAWADVYQDDGLAGTWRPK